MKRRKVHLRDIRLRNNAGMEFPICAAGAEMLDLDKGHWLADGYLRNVTCKKCRTVAPLRYPWAYSEPAS